MMLKKPKAEVSFLVSPNPHTEADGAARLTEHKARSSQAKRGASLRTHAVNAYRQPAGTSGPLGQRQPPEEAETQLGHVPGP